MKGWIKLHRKLLKSHIWLNSTPQQKTILMAIIMMVNHKNGTAEINGEIIKVAPGQMITSINSIKENCGKGVSIQNIRTALNRFKKLEFLTVKSTKQYSFITVCKYASYQHEKESPNKEPNVYLTTNKNVKKNKEVYKPNFSGKKPLSILFSEVMLEASPGLFIDKETDLPRLAKISKKIKAKIQSEKKKAGQPFFHASNEEILNEFKYLIKNFPAWEKENRFYPEYILNNFGSLLNKINVKESSQAVGKLSLSSFKNLQK